MSYKYHHQTMRDAVLRGIEDFNRRLRRDEDSNAASVEGFKVAAFYYREFCPADNFAVPSNGAMKTDWRRLGFWPELGIDEPELIRTMKEIKKKLISMDTEQQQIVEDKPTRAKTQRIDVSSNGSGDDLIAQIESAMKKAKDDFSIAAESLNKKGIKSSKGMMWSQKLLYSYVTMNWGRFPKTYERFFPKFKERNKDRIAIAERVIAVIVGTRLTHPEIAKKLMAAGIPNPTTVSWDSDQTLKFIYLYAPHLIRDETGTWIEKEIV